MGLFVELANTLAEILNTIFIHLITFSLLNTCVTVETVYTKSYYMPTVVIYFIVPTDEATFKFCALLLLHFGN